MNCPSCNTLLLTLQKPCYKCGMMFMADLLCPMCGRPEHEHLRQCPKKKLKCPLCHQRRHRHDIPNEQTVEECQWNQCFGEPPSATPEKVQQFAEWLLVHKNDPAGAIDAERIIRQRNRKRK